MAKKKPSFDMSKIKDFFFQKGERVGLGVAGTIALLLLVMAFLGITTRPPASANSSTWGDAFAKVAKDSKSKIDTSTPPPSDGKSGLVEVNPKDAVAAPSPYPSLYEVGILADDKRRNPPVLGVSNDEQGVQVDYKLAPALVYKIIEGQKKIWVHGGQPVKTLEPKRMMVVSAAFPYAAQVNAIRQALRYEPKDALKESDKPHFLGLNIYRSEVVPKGAKQPDAVPLYVYDQERDKTVVAPGLDKFFRRMVIDTHNPAELGSVLGPNMVTPLPFLASVVPDGFEKYPKLRLGGFDQPEGTDDDPKSKKPMAQGLPRAQPNPGAVAGKGSDDRAQMIAWKKLGDTELLARLEGNYNVFDPYARPDTKADAGKDNKPNMSPNFNPNIPNLPNKGTGPQIVEDGQSRLLVRFIDIDLQVGKTYQYWIQVRMANPNFGAKDVAEMKLAQVKELPAGFTETPPVTIPEEMFYYAVDQFEVNGPKMGLVGTIQRGKDILDNAHVSDTAAPVQIHRWIDWLEPQTNTRPVGDWIVAERLLVRRGDMLGRRQHMTDAPEWDDNRGRFVLGKDSKDKQRKPQPVAVEFVLKDQPSPLLVDFRGGEHNNYRLSRKASALPMADKSATELLILDADGRLLVRNTHDDSRDPLRLEHYNRWASRVKAVREASTNTNKGPSRIVPGFGR